MQVRARARCASARHQVRRRADRQGPSIWLRGEEDQEKRSVFVGTVSTLVVTIHFAKKQRYDLVWLLLAWQFGLLMQIPEWIAWRDIRLGRRATNLLHGAPFG